jgi:beta-glucosidase
VNGHWACENEHTLKTLLKGYFNFSGFVVSDWGATHSTNQSLQNGLDIEMPTGKYFTPANIQVQCPRGSLCWGRKGRNGWPVQV